MYGHRHDTRLHISNVKIEHRCEVVEFYYLDALGQVEDGCLFLRETAPGGAHAVLAEFLTLSVGPVKSNQDVRGKARPSRSHDVPTFNLRVHLPFTIPIFLMRATNVVGLIPSRSAAPPFP